MNLNSCTGPQDSYALKHRERLYDSLTHIFCVQVRLAPYSYRARAKLLTFTWNLLDSFCVSSFIEPYPMISKLHCQVVMNLKMF